MDKRKLKIVKITERDGETPKKSHPHQDFSYDELIGKTFVEAYETKENSSMFLFNVNEDGVIISDLYLRTSYVVEVKQDDRSLVVTTKNTVYFFEIIEPNN